MRSAVVVAGLAAVVVADTWTSTVTEDVTITSCGPTVTNCPYKSSTTTSVDGYAWGEWDPASSTTTTTTTDSWGEWETSSTTSVKKADPTSSSSTDSWVWSDWDPTSTTSSKKAAATSSSTDSWGEWDSATTSATGKKVSVTTTTATTSATAACPTYTATGPPEWFSLLPTSVLSSIAAEWTGGPPADWCYYTYSTASLSTTSTPVKATGTVSASPYWPTGASTTAYGTGAAKASGTVTGAVGKWTGAANSNAGSMALAGLAAAAAMVLA